jgi:hypothetical protein
MNLSAGNWHILSFFNFLMGSEMHFWCLLIIQWNRTREQDRKNVSHCLKSLWNSYWSVVQVQFIVLNVGHSEKGHVCWCWVMVTIIFEIILIKSGLESIRTLPARESIELAVNGHTLDTVNTLPNAKLFTAK